MDCAPHRGQFATNSAIKSTPLAQSYRIFARWSSPPSVDDVPQLRMRHLVMVDLFVRRPIPTTLFQITPQFASGSEGHTAVEAFVRSDHGEHLGVVVEDHEASPTGGSAITCAHPFHFHATSEPAHC